MILKPIFTEKSYGLNAFDRFSFKVDKRATKEQIKKAVQALYGVDVVSINTARSKSRSTRVLRTGKYVTTPGYKKAVVKLKSGQKIKLFNT